MTTLPPRVSIRAKASSWTRPSFPTSAKFLNGHGALPAQGTGMSLSPVPSTVAAFRALHESGCFVLPNPWDVGTALYLRHLGFKALATTSAGAAFARGLPDDVSAIPLDVMLTHIREIVAETGLPVNADFQAGYADEPAGVATIVKAVAPKSVNVLVSAPVPGLSLSRLADLGVRRVSVGPALALVAWGAFIRAARRLAEDDSFDGLTHAISFSELNALFRDLR